MTAHNVDAGPALPTGTWKLDPTRTTVTVTAKKLGFITVPATVAVTAGTIEIDNSHQVSSVEVIADASSYTSGNAKRDVHVRSADFLDADNHPELVFRAGTAESALGGFRTDGSVTVKGETHPLSIDIADVEFDTLTGSFRATATVDRNAIGVAKLPSLIIARTLQVTVAATVVNSESDLT